MKSKHSNSKKAFTPYKNSLNHFFTLDNKVSKDTISSLLIDTLPANNTLWFQLSTKTLSSSIVPSALS